MAATYLWQGSGRHVLHLESEHCVVKILNHMVKSPEGQAGCKIEYAVCQDCVTLDNLRPKGCPVYIWVWAKLNHQGTTSVPFGVPIFDPQPHSSCGSLRGGGLGTTHHLRLSRCGPLGLCPPGFILHSGPNVVYHEV